MVAIVYPRRLPQLLDVTQPQGTGLPNSGVPVLHSSNSSFVIETIAGGAGGSFSLGASNIGNTLGDTGVTGSRVVLAGIGNLTLSQATDANGGTISISGGTAGAGGGVAISASNSLFSTGTVVLTGAGGGATVNTAAGSIQISVAAPVAQTVQTQSRFNLTLDGNTAGALALVSSGVLTLAGGNSITLSQNGNAITISGATTSQSVQTQNMVAVTLSGNTSGAQALISSGTMTLAGGNNITVSQNGNAVTISGPNVGGAQTGISGIGNSQTTYTSGTVSMSELGAITIRSTTGNQFQFSVNAQSVQPETQTFVGGIAASNTTYTSGTITITGVGGGVTVSSNTGQRVDISVAAPVAQTNQTEGWYAVGNTTGQSSSTTLDARTISVRGDGIISAGYSGGSLRISATQSVQTQSLFSAGVSTGGNTAGDTGVTGTRMVFVGSNNITLSQATAAAGGTITISGPTTAAQTNQSLGMYAVQNTTGQSSSTTMDARTISVAGDGAVSVGYSAGSLRISVPTQTVESQSFGMSNIGNTSGTTGIASGGQVRFLLAGGNNVTLSQSLNGASGTITISAFNQTNQSLGMYAVNNTTGQSSSTTMDARTLSVAGDGAVSVGYSAGSLRISAPAQTGTQFSAGISGGNTSGDTGTVAGRVVFAGGNNVTLSGSTNGVSETITISAFNQTVESQSIGMSNLGNTAGTTGIASGGQVRFLFAGTNNITLSQSLNGASGTISISGAPSFSAGVSTGGNTAGATGITGTNLVWVGSNNITLSQTTGANGGTVSIFGPTPGAAQYSIGVSNIGNTAGSTGVTGTRIVFAGTNNITLSQSTDATGATISLSGQPAFSAGVSTGGNTAGATGLTGTQMVWVGSSPISLSQTTGANGGTITINAPATSSLIGVSGISVSTNGSTISVFPTPRTSFTPHDEVMQVTGQQGQGSLHIQPMHAPHLQYDRMLLSYQISNASNSSNSFTLSNWVGIYTKNVSTLSLVSSISTSTNFSGSGTVGSYTLYGGIRQLSIPWTMTLSDGDYWVGIVTRTTTGGGAGHTLNQLLKSQFTSATLTGWSGLLGAATNASVQREVGLGTYSVSTSGIPNSIAFSEITGTGSLPLFVPLFQFRSGTV